MANLRLVKKIGVFGHVGNKNLGDEAIIAAVIQNIRRRHPGAEIYAFTLHPDDTQERHKVTAFPIRRVDNDSRLRRPGPKTQSSLSEKIRRRSKQFPLTYAFLRAINKCIRLFWNSLRELGFLVKCAKNLIGLDLLIIAGSNQLFDYWGGPWGFPYTLFKWSIIARALGTKVAFLSVGAGPINSSLGKFFIKHSLSLASYRSYRDESSRRLIEKIGFSGENGVFPDLVFSLQIAGARPASAQTRRTPIVGINPMPFFDQRYWPEDNAERYGSYVRKLACFTSWLIHRGYMVLFFPTQLRADPPVIKDIRLIMKDNGTANSEQRIIDRTIYSFEDLVSVISMTDIVFATRFHGVLLAYLLNKPVLGIAYWKKTEELMSQMGQSDYVLDVNRFELDSLKRRFISLESKTEIIKREIQSRNLDQKYTLDRQYDRVLGLLEEGPSVAN